MVFVSVGKCLPVCTVSHQTHVIHHSEWQDGHKCHISCDWPNLRSVFYKVIFISV